MNEPAFRALIFLFVIFALMVVINDIRKDTSLVSPNNQQEFATTSQPELIITASNHHPD